MGSDQKTASENGRIYYFDSLKEDKDEMKRVKPLLDLDHWARAYGDEEFKVLLEKLAGENKRNNRACYGLAECFCKCIESGGKPKDESVIKSDNYAFFRALIEELGIDLDTVKGEDLKDNYFDITLPMSDGPFTASVKPFDPYVPERLWGEVGKKVDPRWHYFVSWAKYWDVILNSSSEYAAKLRERDPKHAKSKRIGGFSNDVLKKWCGRS